ncbi:stage IV sporulation pro-sigma-K processing enzyme [Halalkalibacter wakoensis JCM 9140]|uniref:Stage IV sporulation pro-sigma-K processing enzyme n=1 Tax=Halalkalibacter wakoensis JCM 9140 TaxID=1236970 RepID=W4Q7J8_9BACI|nr:M50 family metallopeptidase [Halalkalibacter wakoensis]GAE27683.1 stage IV sporulation pro-sigma-K processing enzyme [Halalkalibacter wakoensis JCM 9140]
MRELIAKFKVNPLFWFVLGIGVFTGYFREVLMIFSIVLIHELGHALAAHFFKWRITKIELLPFGGVAEVEDVGNRPFHEELIVILAGPLQHIWMMLLSYFLVQFPFWTSTDHHLFIWHNAMILLFNLIPVLPLDGGRLVQLWYTYRFPYVQALTISRWTSSFVLLAMVFISLIWFPYHLNLWVIITFLFLTNYLEYKQRHYRFMRFLMARRTMQATEKSVVAVKDTLPLKEAMKRLKRGRYQLYKVFQVQTGTAHVIEEKELLELHFTNNKPHASLSQLIQQLKR